MFEEIGLGILVSYALSISAIIVNVMIYYRQMQLSRVQHFIGDINKIYQVLRDMNHFASRGMMLKDSITTLHKYFQDPDLISPSFQLMSFGYLHAIYSTLKLNESCTEFLELFKTLRKEGVTEGIRRLNWSLHGLLLEMRDASEGFLRVDISPLGKNVGRFIKEYPENERLLDQILERISILYDLSTKCLNKLNKLHL
jgi:hypothetical protein